MKEFASMCWGGVRREGEGGGSYKEQKAASLLYKKGGPGQEAVI